MASGVVNSCWLTLIYTEIMSDQVEFIYTTEVVRTSIYSVSVFFVSSAACRVKRDFYLPMLINEFVFVCFILPVNSVCLR